LKKTINYLKENNLIYKIPVVIITGDDTQETIEKAYKKEEGRKCWL